MEGNQEGGVSSQGGHQLLERPKLEEEERIPNDISDSITNFDNQTIPNGFERIYKTKGKNSILFDYGVRVDRISAKDTPPQDCTEKVNTSWFCLASAACRTKGFRLDMKRRDNLSQATIHLKKYHNITTGRAEKKNTKRKREAGAAEVANSSSNGGGGSSSNRRADPSRALRLHAVTALIVSQFSPFDHFEDPAVAQFFAAGFPALEVTKLHSKKVRHLLVELYVARRNQIAQDIQTARNTTNIPMFHLNVDIWRDVVSEERFVGVRLFWNEGFRQRSELLATRPFNPSPILDAQQAHVILHRWLMQVLEEYGLTEGDIHSSTTDGGSDVKCMVGNNMPGLWEPCIPQLLNATITEGFGLTEKISSCRNKDARDLVFGMQTVVTELARSGVGRQRLTEEADRESAVAAYTGAHCPAMWYQNTPKRWVDFNSLMERFLVIMSTANVHQPIPLADHCAELEELYAIMKPMSIIIQACQVNSVHTGAQAVLRLIHLRTTVLNIATPLAILDPRSTAAGVLNPQLQPMPRQHQFLTLTARKTRDLTAKALDKRFFSTRYVEPYPDNGFAHDISLFLNPLHCELKYLNALVGLVPSFDAEACEKVKAEIMQRIRARLTDIVVRDTELRKEPVAAAVPSFGESPAGNADMMALFGVSLSATSQGQGESGASANSTRNETTEEIVEKALQTYLTFPLGKSATRLYEEPFNGQAQSDWWALVGSKYEDMWPLATLARINFACAASAGIAESEFSASSHFLSRQRSTLDPCYVEMVLFLHGAKFNTDAFETVDEIAESELVQHIPTRWTDDRMKEEVKALNIVDNSFPASGGVGRAGSLDLGVDALGDAVWLTYGAVLG